jgi:3-oxoacyl-[acyl-carrier protein] reductase
MELDLWRKVQAINIDSMFLMTREVLKFMADGGRIINVASLAGHNGGGNGSTAYAASKSAVFGFTRGLAKEVAERAITVNALAPGLILDTPFHETFTEPDAQRAAIQSIALKRPGMPTDVAGPALWLASEHASFVTGSVVDINGGQYFA